MAPILPSAFNLIFDNTTMGVLILHRIDDGTLKNARILYINKSLIDDFLNGEENKEKQIALVEPFFSNDKGESLLPLSETENKVIVVEAERATKNFKKRWIEVRAQPIQIMDKPVHIFWFNDITKTKRKEIAAQQKAEQADAISEAKSAFLATMSHELRTPMQSVFGLLELMSEYEVNDETSQMIHTAQDSANGMLEILDDILDIAKVDAGKMELDEFEIPVRTLTYGLIEAMRIKATEQKLELKAEVDEDVPLVIKGDPKRLRQILINLIGNGLKFTERGGVTVRVKSGGTVIGAPKDGAVLRFEVEDTGIGMPPEVLDKLFIPFTQADNSTSRKFGGTGLGLSIADRLVHLMSGEIGATSESGKGSTFFFEIPAKIAEGTETLDQLPDLKGLTILSVEDHPNASKEIANSLEYMGARVTSVKDFTSGKELIEHQPFDIAIIDHGLPDGEGIELIKIANKLRPGMGLILYTVFDDYRLRQGCKFIGARYLSKPASRLGLGNAVKDAAQKSYRPKSFEGTPRILLTEDNLSIIDIFKRQIKRFGIDVDIAHNGQEAFNQIIDQDYAMLITDLHMPLMDGYELAQNVAQLPQFQEERLPIVAITADVQLAQPSVYIEKGFDECLLKPISLGQIRQLLVRWGFIDRNESLTQQSEREETEAEEDAGIARDDVPINIYNIEEQLGEIDESAIEMIEMFLEVTTKQLDGLKEAINNDNAPEVKKITHSMKGAARSAACEQLGNITETLQTRAEELDHFTPKDYEEVEAALKAIKDYIPVLARQISER